MAEILHTDDPARAGNLTAAEYAERQSIRAEATGDDGLHIIPADVLAAAQKRAEEL